MKLGSMAYQRKDHYYKKAKKEGKPSRAAYKIEQIQKKLKLINRGDVVIDIGCSPGGWLKEISKMVGPKGNVIGVDVKALRVEIPKNSTFILGDIMSPDAINQICLRLTRDADVIVSDMAPNLSGISFRDAYHSYELAARALEICRGILKEGGNFVVKVFPGKEITILKKLMEKLFKKVETIIPPATRKTSSEQYLIGMGHKKT
jgi:23S rRNA (uridine2552-2'-O)-methyltransferase